jgi:predicted HicB family RNase H-like nuclease
MDKRNQTRAFMLRMTEEQYQLIAPLAKSEGRSVTNWINHMIATILVPIARKGK